MVNSQEDKSSISYASEIDRIKNSSQSPDLKLELLDILIKDFLRKKYHFKRSIEYDEMVEFFIEKNLPNLATFCHEIIMALYSGDLVNANNVSILLDEAKSMLERESQSAIKINEDESIFSPIFNKFKTEKKSFQAMKDTGHVSKQTMKIIGKYIDEDNSINNQIKDPVLDEKTGKSLIYDLNPSLIPNGQEDDPEFRMIRNIDDLERIKSKIRYKKASVMREKTSSN